MPIRSESMASSFTDFHTRFIDVAAEVSAHMPRP